MKSNALPAHHLELRVRELGQLFKWCRASDESYKP